jgi:predicted nucleic acid-binding Zn ribbon protein
MERASRLIGKMKFPDGSVTPQEVVCAAWSGAVGPRIALHTRAERLVRAKLIVGVDDMVWQRQLFTMSHMILGQIESIVGFGLVNELEFRISPPKRGPQRAVRSLAASREDEADGIEDPGLRRLYLGSRKKEMA